MKRQIDVWGSWGEWGKCSRSCGGGVSFRQRRCYSQRWGLTSFFFFLSFFKCVFLLLSSCASVPIYIQNKNDLVFDSRGISHLSSLWDDPQLQSCHCCFEQCCLQHILALAPSLEHSGFPVRSGADWYWQQWFNQVQCGRPGGEGGESRAVGFSPESQWLYQDFLRLRIPRKVNCPRRNGRVELAQVVLTLCHLICSWVRCSEDDGWDLTCWKRWTWEILLWIKTKKRGGKKPGSQ